jgi:ParB-like chromosome segregation protein Spo0J
MVPTRQIGLLQPILVRAEDTKYEIITSKRRYQAIQTAKLFQCHCTLKKVLDA